MAKKREIIVKHGCIKKLAEDTGYSVTTVKYALRGAIDTAASELIRFRAKRFYRGKEI